MSIDQFKGVLGSSKGKRSSVVNPKILGNNPELMCVIRNQIK